MPVSPLTVTTTLFPTVFSGNGWLQSVTFKNGSSTGIIYMLNRANRNDTVSSTLYDFSLGGGSSVNFTVAQHGSGIQNAVWDAISDTAGGVTLETTALYMPERSR